MSGYLACIDRHIYSRLEKSIQINILQNIMELGVLKEITPYLLCLQITNPKTYRGPWRALFRKICALLILLTFSAGMFTFNSCLIWKSITNGVNFQAISVHLATVQVISSHISGLRNYRKISQTFEYLSNAIAPRKFSICENILV